MELLFPHIQAQRSSTQEQFAARIGVPVLLYKQQRIAAKEVPQLMTRTVSFDENVNPELLATLPKDIHSYRLQRLPAEKRRLRIGRQAGCDVVVNEKSVSSVHAFLDVAPGGIVELTDDDSRNGTRVNGVAVKGTVRLKSNDEIMLGSLRMQFFLPADLYQFLKTLA